jgi:hypothetical protein
MSRETAADTGDTADEYDEETHVERTDVGVSIETKIQRGTGTNDRDTITAKVKAETRANAVADLQAIEDDLHDHLAEVRGWQPDQENEG